MILGARGTNGRPHWRMLAAATLAAGCLEGGGGPGEADSADAAVDPAADPAPLRAGPPRVRLGSWTGEGHTDFYDIAGVVVDRSTDALTVANRGDATLRTFTLDGEWRSTQGGVGSGPRELEELTALFEYRGDSLAAYDGERGDVSIWPYAGGDVRRVPVPTLAGDTLRTPRFHGSTSAGRLVWTVSKPDRIVDELGESHPRHLVIFLTSPEGAGFDPIAETTGERFFQYGGDAYLSGRIPFSPRAFVLSRDSVIFFGSTERPRAERVSDTGAPLAPIAFSLTAAPVTAAHRETALAGIRARLDRPLPTPLRTRVAATLEVWAFPDTFPVLGDVVAGEDGRVWVTGSRAPEAEPALAEADVETTVWSVYAGPGSPGRDIAFPGDFRLLWADEIEAIGVVRDELDIEHVLIVPLPPAAGPTDS